MRRKKFDGILKFVFQALILCIIFLSILFLIQNPSRERKKSNLIEKESSHEIYFVAGSSENIQNTGQSNLVEESKAEEDNARASFVEKKTDIQQQESPTAEPIQESSIQPETIQPLPHNVDPNRPMIAFSFDDGPYTAVTGKILDVLEAHQSRATFFVVGNRVKNYAEVLKRTVALGCEIGNHSFSHKNFEKLSVEQIIAEINSTNQVVKEVSNYDIHSVRVPYGNFRNHVRSAVNFPIIQWDIDSLDWKTKNTEAIVSSILSSARDGAIVLMHDLYETTAQAVVQLVPQLISQGYQIVSVEEMYAAKGLPLNPNQVYYGIK
ncbi:hypothetical protein FACS189418_8830 [Clostridia bacterium]|nr:hypothetical protein FACS189418_8830 [Clostridia bacterium]